MDDECFRFVCQFRPVHVLAMMPLKKLLMCKIPEIRALARYVGFNFDAHASIDNDFIARLQFFCDRVVDQKFIVQRPDHDYRLFLFNALRYKESPQYLLNMVPEDICKCTARQLQCLLKHLRRHVRRCATWPVEFRQLFFNTIACGDLFPVQNLVQQLEKIFQSSEFVLDSVPVFEKTTRLGTRPLEESINVDEIIFMFESYDWISPERMEAKIIATGFGLDPKLLWPTANDYHLFSRAAQCKNFYFSRQATVEQRLPREGSCLFCCSSDVNTVRIPCGHVVGCVECESRYASPSCAICRQSGTFYKIYKS